MFQNPSTLWIEILVLLLIVAFLGIVIGIYIYKKVHHLPTGECACCQNKGKNLVNKYHKKYCKNCK